MNKVLLELTPEQAKATLNALDLFTRIGLGQLETITDLLQSEALHVRPSNESGPIASLDQIDEINSLLMLAKNAMGHSSSQSFGVKNPNVHIDAKRTYEISKVLSTTLAKGSDEHSDSSTASEGLMIRLTDDLEPKAYCSSPTKGTE
ncbi:hypothetical protein [Vibrio owensii]|uniref:hypothetical protein n=1 Tax=Vibrio harveyi group TaxID=717610 RepID=UPI003CC56387